MLASVVLSLAAGLSRPRLIGTFVVTNGSQKRENNARAEASPRLRRNRRQRCPPVRTGVQTLKVEADEAGMRLDRWFKQRFPGPRLSHLAKIALQGRGTRRQQARGYGDAAEGGQAVRVPPLTLETLAAPAVKRLEIRKTRRRSAT